MGGLFLRLQPAARADRRPRQSSARRCDHLTSGAARASHARARHRLLRLLVLVGSVAARRAHRAGSCLVWRDASMADSPSTSGQVTAQVTAQVTGQVTAHALQIGDRINTAGFEGPLLSNAPLAVRVGSQGLAVVFRYGVAVFVGLTADEEAEFLERLQSRTFGKISPHEDGWAKIQIAKEGDEPIPVGGPILVRDLSVE